MEAADTCSSDPAEREGPVRLSAVKPLPNLQHETPLFRAPALLRITSSFTMLDRASVGAKRRQQVQESRERERGRQAVGIDTTSLSKAKQGARKESGGASSSTPSPRPPSTHITQVDADSPQATVEVQTAALWRERQ